MPWQGRHESEDAAFQGQKTQVLNQGLEEEATLFVQHNEDQGMMNMLNLMTTMVMTLATSAWYTLSLFV